MTHARKRGTVMPYRSPTPYIYIYINPLVTSPNQTQENCKRRVERERDGGREFVMETSSGDHKGNLFFVFRRLGDKKKKSSWRFKNSWGLRWKKKWTSFSLLPHFHWLLDNFLFKIVSVFEGFVLVSTLCFFFLCCGCHF